MEAAGFDNYSLEWWHYRLSPEPDETLYFCFPAWDGMQEK
jgi:D-alanyl-D-alanine dipeptidase